MSLKGRFRVSCLIKILMRFLNDNWVFAGGDWDVEKGDGVAAETFASVMKLNKGMNKSTADSFAGSFNRCKPEENGGNGSELKKKSERLNRRTEMELN
ncbi:hypothetical protein Hanom_Chr14g01295751 [Helianthus anomalus]